MSLGVNRVYVRIRSSIPTHHLHESPTIEIAFDIPAGPHQDSVSIERPIYRYFPVIGGQIASHFDCLRSAIVIACCDQTPKAVSLVALADADTVMPGQFRRIFWLATFSEIFGRSTQQAAVGCQELCDNSCISRSAKTNAYIELIIS